MLTRIEGTRNAVRWPEAGGVVDLPDGEAADLIAAGLAEPEKATSEKATAPAPERATAPNPTEKKAQAPSKRGSSKKG